MTGKLIIFSAPSGAGKTTVVKELLKRFSNFEFSVSATSRAPRGVEQDGVDYHFLSNDEFMKRVEQKEFVEWEEVYAGTCYGTLHSEMQRIWAKGNVILFDVDVIGGIRLKEIFGDAACSIFVMPPSIETLRKRLIGRATDSAEVIEKRVGKAEFEISKSPQFDHTIINDDLAVAVAETEAVIRQFLEA
ncbi:MAG: guanylate kinase [Rikenellaceae bacterium]